ncbi:hypothetical protein DSM110093_04253 (plasmid) [Sulfitobacter sp. DSM 110093]|uniref:hypothetical protein n=1 Tax=Sulfitobacter sp. DSM 110093 TaxID=2883127 RepID=UPI001FAD82BA|nr:hypothetical protein [Sulfitobacter sp. DSM 110093]UOA34417.1 hypothetical protein DSM110093_04253 [Sulfitobacter sp. DSM 110093]
MKDDDSNAKFDNIDPELRRMIEDRTLKTIEIADAAMRLKGGKLTLRASDLLPKETNPDTPRDPNQPMTGAERQKKLYQERTDAGWKKTWVPPELIQLADDLGGIENVVRSREEWMRRAIEAEKQKKGWLGWPLNWLFRKGKQ